MKRGRDLVQDEIRLLEQRTAMALDEAARLAWLTGKSPIRNKIKMTALVA